ncbi:MAG TPA: hypothetical protein VJ725_28840 [Thermoanaerobaculia bacterium]|nr:hypothetical protein [Thermoanaerobaculia bacterium]
MHISDFHTKFVSGNEQNVLLGALQKLSRLESLSFLTGEDNEPMSDWVIWADGTTGMTNAVANV